MSSDRLLDCDLPLGRLGVVAHNELVLSGWAISPLGVSGVAVQIEDRVWNAAYGLDTPWLVRQAPAEAPNVTRAGYHLRIDTSDWVPGSYYVTVAAFDMQGGRQAVEGPVEIQPFETADDEGGDLSGPTDGPVLHLDQPLTEDRPSEITLPLRVTGWATASHGIETVLVTLDGRVQYEALRPIARPELLDRHGAEIASKAGFALQFAVSECPPGPHALTVVARQRDGETVGVERRLICRPPAQPEPAPAPGTVTPVEWLERRETPAPGPGTLDRDLTVAMWRDRALLAEADAAASRAEANLALREQESTLRDWRRAAAAIAGQLRTAEARRAEQFAREGGSVPSTGQVHAGLEHHARYAWAARLSSAARVLDVACGTGAGTARPAQFAHEAVGVDVSPAAVEDARAAHGEAATFHVGDMRSLPFEAGEFDVVVCFEALTHVAETDLVLDELRRVLRPGGLLVVSCPNRDAYPPGNPLELAALGAGELERALSERFANVAVHGQQSYFAALLGTPATLAHSDPKVQIEADVLKLAATAPGAALHSVAVATDLQLPPEPAWLTLGEQPSAEEQRRQLEAWQQRAVEAEAEAAELRSRLQR